MIFDLDKVRLARKLNPAPIIEAVVEIRFDSTLLSGNVVNKLLLEFGKEYSVKDLPLLQIPEPIRDNDPQFQHLPVKQLIKDGLILQIGGRVISFVNKGDYIGWPSLKANVRLMVEKLRSANVASRYKRLGVRYLNVINSNILEHINLILATSEKQIIEEGVDLRLGFAHNQYRAKIRLSNNLRKIDKGEKITGTLIDIDTFIEGFKEDDLLGLVDGAHTLEKQIFFALVKKDYIDKNFKPEWA